MPPCPLELDELLNNPPLPLAVLLPAPVLPPDPAPTDSLNSSLPLLLLDADEQA
jgi:hypothetical protein